MNNEYDSIPHFNINTPYASLNHKYYCGNLVSTDLRKLAHFVNQDSGDDFYLNSDREYARTLAVTVKNTKGTVKTTIIPHFFMAIPLLKEVKKSEEKEDLAYTQRALTARQRENHKSSSRIIRFNTDSEDFNVSSSYKYRAYLTSDNVLSLRRNKKGEVLIFNKKTEHFSFLNNRKFDNQRLYSEYSSPLDLLSDTNFSFYQNLLGKYFRVSSDKCLVKKFNTKYAKDFNFILPAISLGHKDTTAYKRSVRYFYNRYGTKAGRAKALNTSNKVLQSFIINAMSDLDCYSPSRSAETLEAFLTMITPENTSHLVQYLKQSSKNVKENFCNSFSILLLHTFFNISFKAAVNFVSKSEYSTSISYLLDDKRMFEVLENYHTREELKSLTIYSQTWNKTNNMHTELIRHYNQISKKATMALNTFKYSEETIKAFEGSLMDEKYSISLAKSNHELTDTGNSMSICVGSYTTSVMRKQCDILLIKDKQDSKPVACIEVRGGSIVQAKLKNNRVLKSDSELCKAFSLYCEERDLGINTYDINEYPDFSRKITVQVFNDPPF